MSLFSAFNQHARYWTTCASQNQKVKPNITSRRRYRFMIAVSARQNVKKIYKTKLFILKFNCIFYKNVQSFIMFELMLCDCKQIFWKKDKHLFVLKIVVYTQFFVCENFKDKNFTHYPIFQMRVSGLLHIFRQAYSNNVQDNTLRTVIYRICIKKLK